MPKKVREITDDRIIEACSESLFGMGHPGFCKACGEDAEGVEPDARNYECDYCGEKEVFGAEEMLY